MSDISFKRLENLGAGTSDVYVFNPTKRVELANLSVDWINLLNGQITSRRRTVPIRGLSELDPPPNDKWAVTIRADIPVAASVLTGFESNATTVYGISEPARVLFSSSVAVDRDGRNVIVLFNPGSSSTEVVIDVYEMSGFGRGRVERTNWSIGALESRAFVMGAQIARNLEFGRYSIRAESIDPVSGVQFSVEDANSSTISSLPLSPLDGLSPRDLYAPSLYFDSPMNPRSVFANEETLRSFLTLENPGTETATYQVRLTFAHDNPASCSSQGTVRYARLSLEPGEVATYDMARSAEMVGCTASARVAVEGQVVGQVMTVYEDGGTWSDRGRSMYPLMTLDRASSILALPWIINQAVGRSHIHLLNPTSQSASVSVSLFRNGQRVGAISEYELAPNESRYMTSLDVLDEDLCCLQAVINSSSPVFATVHVAPESLSRAVADMFSYHGIGEGDASTEVVVPYVLEGVRIW